MPRRSNIRRPKRRKKRRSRSRRTKRKTYPWRTGETRMSGNDWEPTKHFEFEIAPGTYTWVSEKDRAPMQGFATSQWAAGRAFNRRVAAPKFLGPFGPERPPDMAIQKKMVYRSRRRRRRRRPTRRRRRTRRTKRRFRRGRMRRARPGSYRAIMQRYKHATIGRVMRTNYSNNWVTSAAENQCIYTSDGIGLSAQFTALMDDEYKALGQTDALGTRTEVYDLTGNSFSLMYNGRMTFYLKNNYFTDCYLTYWVLYPKTNLGSSPETDVISGLDDLALSDAGWETDITFWPRDSKVFKSNWKVHRKGSVKLNPGGQTTISCNTGWHVWSPDYLAAHPTQTRYKGRRTMFIMYRIQGGIANDGATSAGYNNAKIDCVSECKYTYRHIGGLQKSYSKRDLTIKAYGTTLSEAQPVDPAMEL